MLGQLQGAIKSADDGSDADVQMMSSFGDLGATVIDMDSPSGMRVTGGDCSYWVTVVGPDTALREVLALFRNQLGTR